LNILLVAEESAGIRLLRALLRTEHRIVAVMTSTTGPSKTSSMASVATRAGLDIWPPSRVRDPALARELRAAGVDLILNAHSLYLIHEEVLRAPSIAAFNLHPGPLPRYSGLNCPSWAIYRAERTYGVTVHRMSPRIDAGPIAYQTTFDIDEAATGFTLTAKCVSVGVPLMRQLVEVAARDPAAIPAIEQDVGQRKYFGREVPRNGALIWSESASQIARFVRAFDYYPFASPWGHPQALYEGQHIGVVKAVQTRAKTGTPPGTLRRGPSGIMEVAAADEWLALHLVHAGGRHIRPDQLLRDGTRLEDGTKT